MRPPKFDMSFKWTSFPSICFFSLLFFSWRPQGFWHVDFPKVWILLVIPWYFHSACFFISYINCRLAAGCRVDQTLVQSLGKYHGQYWLLLPEGTYLVFSPFMMLAFVGSSGGCKIVTFQFHCFFLQEGKIPVQSINKELKVPGWN